MVRTTNKGGASRRTAYRPVKLGAGPVWVMNGDGGAVYAGSCQSLGQGAHRTTDRLLHWATATPDRTFLARRDGDDGPWIRLSYAQAYDGARRIAQALLGRGLSAERPVLILSENDLEHAQLALGCQLAGIPYAPLSPAYSLVSQDFGKLRHVVDLLQPGLVFAADGGRYAAALEVCRANGAQAVVTTNAPADATPFSDLLAQAAGGQLDQARLATGPDTIVKFLFTSGSTGMPKAVITTQRMLCTNMQMMLQSWPFLAEEPPVLLDWLPWNHTFGGSKNFNMVLFNGGTLYIDDGKPTPQAFGITLRNLRDIAPTIYFNVPRGWEELALAMEADEALRVSYYSNIRLQFYAAASLPQAVWDRLHALAERTCGQRIVMTTGLGMTETAPCALFVLREEAHAGEVGTPCPGVDIKLAPCGDKVELRYRGPNVTPGYWRAPQATAAAFDDEGYFMSGDAVRWLDPDHPELRFVFDGRVAEDFKLNTGTWVSVGALRGRICHAGTPYVQDAVITGHDRGELGALIVPNLPQCRRLAGLGAEASTADVLAAAPVRAWFGQLANQLWREGTGSATRVARLALLAEPPALDQGEVTDKGSVNQRAMLKHRAHVVDSLYAGTLDGLLLPNE